MKAIKKLIKSAKAGRFGKNWISTGDNAETELEELKQAARELLYDGTVYDSNCSRCCDYTFGEHDEACLKQKLAALVGDE